MLLHVHVGKALEEVPKHEAQASRQLRCTVDLDQSLTPDGIASEACDRTSTLMRRESKNRPHAVPGANSKAQGWARQLWQLARIRFS